MPLPDIIPGVELRYMPFPLNLSTLWPPIMPTVVTFYLLTNSHSVSDIQQTVLKMNLKSVDKIKH